jgi:ABC-type branched-subunit amino acid transport system substrate-binding protein
MPPAHEPLSAVLGELRARQPHAIVLWTAASTAARFISEAGGGMPRTHLYLSQKATQVPLDEVDPREKFAGVWVAVTLPCKDPGTPRDFDARYCAQADIPASLPAAALYDAVRLVAAALREAGPNRARVRDALAGTQDFAGASGTITFDGAGNNVAATRLVPWRKLDVGRAQR